MARSHEQGHLLVTSQRPKGDSMYIGGELVALVVVILLLIWLL